MTPLCIYVDADACPVKDEIYRIAARHGLKVFLVSCSFLRVPAAGRVEHVRVKQDAGSADDWIAERVAPGDIVVTADIPLADRCLKRGARVLAPHGEPFTEDSIGPALADRNLRDYLRQAGTITGGPPGFTGADRSRFRAALHGLIDAAERQRGLR